jgi:hypothetical protein
VVPLVVAEAALYRCVDQCAQERGLEVADKVLGSNKVIARVHTAVVFNDEHPPAGRGHPA